MLELTYRARPRSPRLTCDNPLDISGGATVFGSTLNGQNALQPPLSCVSTRFSSEEEQVFVFAVDESSRMFASTDGTADVDTVLSLSSGGCPRSGRQTLACNDDVSRGELHSLLESSLAPALYYLVLDTIGDGGPYVLTFQIDPI
jgi:hypothetical protein